MTARSVNIRGNTSTVTTQLDDDTRRQAMTSSQLSLRMQQLYSLALIDTSNVPPSVLEFPGVDPGGQNNRPVGGGGNNFAEYFFRVPPKVNEIAEPFATTIVPTQNGGKYVESHGSIIKQIKISGTTGLRPNKQLPAVIPLLHITTEALQNLIPSDFTRRRDIPAGEITGFDDLIFLRNIFRLYSDLKQDDVRAGRVVMIWRNAKDLDYWIVEPSELRLVHSSASPLTYEYNFQLNTLAKYDDALGSIDDPLDRILSRRRFLSRLQEYSFNIQRVLLGIAAGIDRLDGIGVYAVSTILGPAVSLARGVLAIKESISRLGSRTIHQAKTLFNNIADALEKIAALSSSDNTMKFKLHDPIIRNLRRLQITTARLLTEKTLQDTVAAKHTSQRERIVRTYSTGGDSRLGRRPAVTGGSRTFIGASSTPSSLVEEIVGRGETIRDIAARCLGERGRWHELVLLNDLRYPYISSVGSTNVLAPGDTILCPSDRGFGVDAATIGSNNLSDKNTGNLDENKYGPIQQAHGRDLRLKSVTLAHDLDLTDLVVGQDGDLSTIAGIPNVEQAIQLKFATEKGELTVHPFYGSSFAIGTKATVGAFTDFQIDVKRTLRSDTRIKDIEKIDLSMIGDVIAVSAKLRLIDSADLLSTDISLRNI